MIGQHVSCVVHVCELVCAAVQQVLGSTSLFRLQLLQRGSWPIMFQKIVFVL
jgi:hypothetical protein